MKNISAKIKYFFLSVKENILAKMLGRHLDTSFSNSTSKTIISGTETVTLSAQTNQNIELVRKNVSDIMSACANNPDKLLEYIEAQGTKVYKLKNADKILKSIGEEEGLITPLKGYKALYLNFFIKHKIGFTSTPAIVLSEGIIEPYYLLREFYKWYSLNMKLPGFNFEAQENFKKYLKNVNDPSIRKLNYKSMLELKEAIARDSEANEFVINAVKQKEGGANVFKKMNNGGANI